MQNPFTADFDRIRKIATEEGKKVDEKIKSGKYSNYEVMKLYEQKLTPGLFSNLYSAYGKYNSPW